jgi:hypothetical protein
MTDGEKAEELIKKLREQGYELRIYPIERAIRLAAPKVEDPKGEACKAFERWISAPPYEHAIRRWDDSPVRAWPGQYTDYRVQLAWEAWCAGIEWFE